VRRHHIRVALQQQAAGFKVAILRREMQWSPSAENIKGITRANIILRMEVIQV
jgi:hypothetical protein